MTATAILARVGSEMQEIPVTNPLTTLDSTITDAAGVGGGLSRVVAAVSSAAMSGSSVVIATGIPVGAKIIGCQLRVDTLITSGAATSWSAAYSGGAAAQTIATGQAFTKNTKVNKFFLNAVDDPVVATSVGTITITPNTGTFTAGVIKAVVYYEEFTALSSVA